MSFAARDLETVLSELADAEQRVADLTEAVAQGRVHAHRLDMAVYLRDALRRQAADLERRAGRGA